LKITQDRRICPSSNASARWLSTIVFSRRKKEFVFYKRDNYNSERGSSTMRCSYL